MLRDIDFEFFCCRKLRLSNAKVLTFKAEKLRLSHLFTANLTTLHLVDQKLVASRESTTKEATKKSTSSERTSNGGEIRLKNNLSKLSRLRI